MTPLVSPRKELAALARLEGQAGGATGREVRRAQRRRGGSPKRHDATMRAQAARRVTRLPEGYRSESELAKRRRETRERAAKAAKP